MARPIATVQGPQYRNPRPDAFSKILLGGLMGSYKQGL